MKPLTYATVFSGIEGWGLGLSAAGWALQWQCENDPWCRGILRARYGVPIYEDIETLYNQNPARVDALVGSPPCQPFSTAGRRRGTEDDRHLWPAMLAVIQVVRPSWVCVENVTGINGVVLERMCSDMEGQGYEVGPPLIIPACGAGANHRRYRFWIIAHVDGSRKQQPKWHESQKRRRAENSTSQTSPNPHSSGLSKPERKAIPRAWGREEGGTATQFPRFETHGEILRALHGVPREPHRAARIKALGNAVVPQILYLIAMAINQVEAES